MEKIALKINDLSLKSENMGKLVHISLLILEGEVTALGGLIGSGKELLLEILAGKKEISSKECSIFLGGDKIYDFLQMKEKIHLIAMKSPVMQEWTVAEYISMQNTGWYLSRKAKKQMQENAKVAFDEVKIPIDVNRKMIDLSEVERRSVELVRARKEKRKIVLLEDECEGMSEEEIETYSENIKRVIGNDMSVILLCNDRRAVQSLADTFYIFRKGRIVKKWRKSEVSNSYDDISAYVLGNTIGERKKYLDTYNRKAYERKELVYAVKGWENGEKKHEYFFRRGEVSVFSISNNEERYDFFMRLSGRNIKPGEYYNLRGYWEERPKYQDFLNKKIVSFKKNGVDYELLEEMSVGDNLLLPSIRKIPAISYMMSGNKINGLLSKGIGLGELQEQEKVKKMDPTRHILIALNRWYVFRPNVIVMYDPFVGCDEYAISLILSYIKRFVNHGSAVILVKSNLEYVENIADHIIKK